MATITEDFVSFETAKLLKEKGFNEPTTCVYHKGGTFDRIALNTWNDKFITPICAPTLQMAMKWLREVHKLYINIWADPKDVESNDFDIIFRAQVYNGTSNYGTYEFSTYEEAAETAIKYCLENLIYDS